ncbi:sensor histidine kinase [Nonomuraea sp. NPDC050536]|uniref:sensor histidine kinase n=1 Tax=Nonomuraea sp. NPDC050536 TaxID=3364366 RepID=UPI0037C5998A
MKLLNLRMRRITLRARLTLLYGGLFFVAGMLLLGTTYMLFTQQLNASSSKMVVGPVAHPEPPPVADALVVTPDGSRLTGDAAVRWMSDQRATLHQAATTSLLTQSGIALLLVGGAAVGFGWLIAGRVLEPLHQITATARRIAAASAADRNLHERISLDGPEDEVKDLADTFDTMLERLDRSFDGQRRFVANASHELRTPLTLSRALVELAMLRKSASEDVKQLGEGLMEISYRHERLISGLLVLAHADSEITEKAPIDLEDVVRHVADELTPQADKAHVVIHCAADATPTVGDGLLLERLVHNLLENGIRYNTGGWVRVTSRTVADGVELEVSNTGADIPSYEIPSLFEPFRRLGADRLRGAQGAGLGLSIVRSIAHAHGGEATIRPRHEGGLIVTVTLPLRRDHASDDSAA